MLPSPWPVLNPSAVRRLLLPPLAGSSFSGLLGGPPGRVLEGVLCDGGACCFSNQAWVEAPAGALVDVPLAQTGEGIAECELLKWYVQEGDIVEEFQRLCEVQSDKATIEITSRYKGKIHQILYVPGDIVKVGETLLKVIVGENDAALAHSSEVVESETSSDSDNEGSDQKKCGVLCTPAVRHIAKQYGIEISDVHGTGKDGRVAKEDVSKHLAIKETSKDMPTGSTCHDDSVVLQERVTGADKVDKSFEDKTIPLRGFHRSMVKSMTMAAHVPHFHYVEEIRCDALVKLKAAFQQGNTDPNIKHTYLPFLIKSLSMALERYPHMNSSFTEESTEIILKGAHNIGIAMATPFGLVVPNIKKVQSLSILQITHELSRLQQLAINNKLSSDDISGGTITLSNIGAIGGKFGSPLLNLPEVAIIAIGRVQKLPRYAEDGSLYPASIANVCVGADHRVVDGATVASFCTEWKRLVENPELLFLHMR